MGSVTVLDGVVTSDLRKSHITRSGLGRGRDWESERRGKLASMPRSGAELAASDLARCRRASGGHR